MPNSKIPAYRQAGKCQINVECKKQTLFLNILIFDIESFEIHLNFEL